jgi:hypothetical protein
MGALELAGAEDGWQFGNSAYFPHGFGQVAQR